MQQAAHNTMQMPSDDLAAQADFIALRIDGVIERRVQ